MHIKLFLLLITVIIAKQQYAYTVRYSKSYSATKLTQNVGCSQRNMVYGNYIYPQGNLDLLYVLSNPSIYNVFLQCRNQKVFAKAFGTAQDYDLLLKADPNTVAQSFRAQNNMDNYIIDWKYPPSKNYEASKKWLDSFVSALTNFNKNVYIKAPASSFCYSNKEAPQTYLLTQITKAKLIVQMYGEEPGQYTTYDQIFGNTDQVDQNMKCPTYPSYAFLVKKFPHKQFFIEKTLLKEESGYIGPNLQKFLQKSQNIYDKIVFLDSYKAQIIDL